MPTLHFDSIAIVESLRHDDRKTGAQLHEYVSQLEPEILRHAKVELYQCTGVADFRSLTANFIRRAAVEGFVPLLHLEMHGDKENGLQFSDDSTLSWPELAEILQPLNRATRFNLLLVVSACSGISFFPQLNPRGAAPVVGVIGPSGYVEDAELIANFRRFYRALLLHKDGDIALRKLQEDGLQTGGFEAVYAERFFGQTIAFYIAEHCSPKALNERLDQLHLERKAMGRKASRKALSQERSEKQRQLFQGYFRTFFMVDAIPENELIYMNTMKTVMSAHRAAAGGV